MSLQMPPQSMAQSGAMSDPMDHLGSSMQMEEHLDPETSHVHLEPGPLESHLQAEESQEPPMHLAPQQETPPRAAEPPQQNSLVHLQSAQQNNLVHLQAPQQTPPLQSGPPRQTLQVQVQLPQQTASTSLQATQQNPPLSAQGPKQMSAAPQQIPPMQMQAPPTLPVAQLIGGPTLATSQPQQELSNSEYILRELQSLATRVDGVAHEVSQVKQVQAALESLIRGATAPGLSPIKLVPPQKKKVSQKKKAAPKEDAEQPLMPSETVESDGLYDWPPIKTVEECWREMYEGLDGRPSLMSLEEQYGSAWRRKKGQRQRFCEKKQVCDYIKHLAAENRCTHQLAIQHLANKKESLCKLLLRLRQFKKSAREMGGLAGNGLQGGGQSDLHAAMMQSRVQSGGQGGLQAGMHPGMQGGLHIVMQPGGDNPLLNGMPPMLQTGARERVQGDVQAAPMIPSRVGNELQNGMQPEGQSEMHLGDESEMQEDMQDDLQAELPAEMQGGEPGDSVHE